MTFQNFRARLWDDIDDPESAPKRQSQTLNRPKTHRITCQLVAAPSEGPQISKSSNIQMIRESRNYEIWGYVCLCNFDVVRAIQRCRLVVAGIRNEQGSDTVANTELFRKGEANVLDCQFKLDAFCFLSIGLYGIQLINCLHYILNLYLIKLVQESTKPLEKTVKSDDSICQFCHFIFNLSGRKNTGR